MRENLGSIDTVDTHVCATSFKQRKEHFVTCKALYLVRSTYVYASTRPVKTVEQMVVQPKSNNSPMELAVIWEASETQATEMQQPKYSNWNAETETQWLKCKQVDVQIINSNNYFCYFCQLECTQICQIICTLKFVTESLIKFLPTNTFLQCQIYIQTLALSRNHTYGYKLLKMKK